MDALAEFVRESFCGDVRTVQFHAACPSLGTRRYLGLPNFAQCLRHVLCSDVIAMRRIDMC